MRNRFERSLKLFLSRLIRSFNGSMTVVVIQSIGLPELKHIGDTSRRFISSSKSPSSNTSFLLGSVITPSTSKRYAFPTFLSTVRSIPVLANSSSRRGNPCISGMIDGSYLPVGVMASISSQFFLIFSRVDSSHCSA